MQRVVLSNLTTQ